MVVEPGLCPTSLETPKTGFLTTPLKMTYLFFQYGKTAYEMAMAMERRVRMHRMFFFFNNSVVDNWNPDMI